MGKGALTVFERYLQNKQYSILGKFCLRLEPEAGCGCQIIFLIKFQNDLLAMETSG